MRIFVTNKLPEHTTIHWHGILLPNGMDGVGGLTQPHIPVGKTFVYEFEMKHSGTFMYHPHADEMVQMAMGMMGSLVVHPRDPNFNRVDRDFAFLMAAYDIEPGAQTPKVAEMTDFNLWTWNSRVFPGIDPLVVRRNDRVRVRIGNLTMTNHPIHLHGHNFAVALHRRRLGAEGRALAREYRPTSRSAQMRAIEFVADNPGDWAFHCHKSHHIMNAMGHDVPTMIGVDHRGVAERINKLIPDYMLMGERGMADMGEMEMPLPDNTLPMMTGSGPFGADGDGRHVHRREGARRPRAQRLQGPGLVPAPGRHRRLRMEGRAAAAQPRAAAGALQQGPPLKARKPGAATPDIDDHSRNRRHHENLACSSSPCRIGRQRARRTAKAARRARAIDYSKAEETPFGRDGDPKKAKRTVRVDMTDQMRFHPAEITVKRGEIVRFVPVNKGQVMHEMVLGTMDELKEHAELMKKHPGMEHDEPYMAHVAPGQAGRDGLAVHQGRRVLLRLPDPRPFRGRDDRQGHSQPLIQRERSIT